jgi:hypothetical protein
MYREQASQSALSGVPSGPYSGGPKEIDPARLAPGTLAKLAGSMNGMHPPHPVTRVFDGRREILSAMRPRVWWGLAVPLVITVVAFMRGLAGGDGVPLDPWARQPTWMFAPYALAGVLFVAWIFAILRRRSHLDVLHAGTYLFPLDVVIVSPRSAAGRQLVTVRPLGGARDARAHRTSHPRRSELLIRFHDATEIRLPWPGDPESAHRHLGYTQRLLDELTFSGTIDLAFKSDVFFDLRVDASWASAAPDAASTPDAAKERRRSRVTSFVVSELAPAYVVVLGVITAAAPFALRQRAGERMIFQDAVDQGTPEALDDYVAAGGRYRTEAMSVKSAVLDRRRREKLEREADQAREQAASKFGKAETPTPESCSKALEGRQAENHPEVFAMMQRILDDAEGRSATVPVAFRRRTGPRPVGDPSLDDVDRRLAAVETTFVKSFARVFSETCPERVLSFSQVDALALLSSTGLDIAYHVEWTPKRYPPSEAGELEVRAINVVFDVTFHVPGERLETRPKTTFQLTMPPPEERITKARPRSLFKIAAPEFGIERGLDGRLEEHQVDRRVFDAMVARAFDRLYDEVYGLFFRGPPRVPLRDGDPDGGP